MRRTILLYLIIFSTGMSHASLLTFNFNTGDPSVPHSATLVLESSLIGNDGKFGFNAIQDFSIFIKNDNLGSGYSDVSAGLDYLNTNSTTVDGALAISGNIYTIGSNTFLRVNDSGCTYAPILTGNCFLNLGGDRAAYGTSGFGTVLITHSAGWTIGNPTATLVPIPATAWLFGSGVIGLVGIAKRKKNANMINKPDY